MRRLHAILGLGCGAAALALALGGCGLKGITAPEGGPQTTIFIDGQVDTAGVNHIVHLYWFGSDPHGYIAGFEVRLVDSTAAPVDSSWRFTTRTDSVLTVYTPDGYTSAVFEARAINDRGVRDPEPARQRFYFRNLPPVVKLVGKPNAGDRSDTTFASATITWTVTDVDGDASQVVCRIWMDGHADSPVVGSNGHFTVPSDQFLVNGAWASGRRTLYIRGIDDGGLAGPIDSVSWYVKAPAALPDAQGRGRLLLIDDVPSASPPTPQEVRVDTLYANAVANAGLSPGTYSVLRLQTNQPFRSAKDLEQTLKQFRAVVWYRGEQTSVSTVLLAHGSGIGPYLDGGGKLFVESQSLVSAWSSSGPFSLEFLDRYLNADGVFLFGQAPDSSAAWGLASASSVVLRCPMLADSLPSRRTLSELRAFKPRNWSQALVIAPAHSLTQDNPHDFALALAVPQPNNGLFIAQTYPMVSATAANPGYPIRASVVLVKIFGLLGLTAP